MRSSQRIFLAAAGMAALALADCGPALPPPAAASALPAASGPSRSASASPAATSAAAKGRAAAAASAASTKYERNLADGLRHLRQRVAADPGDAVAHALLATAYLDFGFGELARREGRQAVELAPATALAHRSLANALERDLFGRPRYRGFDRPGAIAEWLKAAELDPEDYVAPDHAATLLVIDSSGFLAESPAALDQALDLRKALHTRGVPALVDLRLPELYLFAGRASDAREILSAAKHSARRERLLVMALALDRGVPAAIEEATAIKNNPKRRCSLDQVPETLREMRHYDEAEKLSRETAFRPVAGSARPGASPVPSAAPTPAFWSPTVHYDDLRSPAGDPARAVEVGYRLLTRGEATDAELQAAFVVRAPVELRDWFETASRRWRSSFRRWPAGFSAPLPEDGTVESFLSQATISVDGTGHDRQVRIRPAAQKSDIYYYVSGTNGEYRMFANLGADAAQMGQEALARLDQSDIEGARQWLDWKSEGLQSRNHADEWQGPPFLQLWPKGHAGDAAEIRLMAAELQVESNSAGAAIPILVKWMADAPEERTRILLGRALRKAYTHERRYEEGLASAREAFRQSHSADAFTSLTFFLSRTGHLDEVRTLCHDRMATEGPNDALSLTALGEAESAAGNIDLAVQTFRTLVDGRKNATPEQYNLLAWEELFQYPYSGRAPRDAGHAGSGTPDSARLNTAATALAESGRLPGALVVTQRAMELHPREEVDPSDWYVMGRIAEQLGMNEVAAQDYARVTPGPDNLPDDPHVLAQRRLEQLSGDAPLPAAPPAEASAGELALFDPAHGGSQSPPDVNDLDITPIAIFQPQPPYPAEARNKNETGKVVLKIIVDETGTVSDVQITESDPDFDAVAVATVMQWRYQPVVVNGVPIVWTSAVNLNFRLH